MREYLLKLLKPGDLLFYSGTGFFSRVIKWKTSSEYTHVAVYIGDGKQREFKEGAGAQEVPLRLKNLAMIRRRVSGWSREKSDVYWDEVKGQEYDYIGLYWSFWARQQGRNNYRMFCSEYVVRDDRRAAEVPFLMSEETDADGVTPEDIGKSPSAYVVWMAKVGHLGDLD
jgi:hypothetical protein